MSDFLSIKAASEILKKKKKRVEKACKRGCFEAYQLSNSEWRVSLKSAQEYFDTPDYHEWIAFSVAIKQFGITRNQLNNLRYTGDVACIKDKVNWYAFMEDLSPFFTKR